MTDLFFSSNTTEFLQPWLERAERDAEELAGRVKRHDAEPAAVAWRVRLKGLRNAIAECKDELKRRKTGAAPIDAPLVLSAEDLGDLEIGAFR